MKPSYVYIRNSEYVTRFYWFFCLSVGAAQWFCTLLLAINLSTWQNKFIRQSIITCSSNRISLVLLPQFRKLDNELTPSYQHTLCSADKQPISWSHILSVGYELLWRNIFSHPFLLYDWLTLQRTIFCAQLFAYEKFPIHSGSVEDMETKANNFILLKVLPVFNVSYKSLFGILVKKYQNCRYAAFDFTHTSNLWSNLQSSQGFLSTTLVPLQSAGERYGGISFLYIILYF